MSITIVRAGVLTSVQDGGRVGHAGAGIGRAGAMDTEALELANALVGNAADAPALEITLVGPRLRFSRAASIAVCGADVDLRIDGVVQPAWRRLRVEAGSLVDASRLRHGARAVLAITGGIDVPRVLGSASSDLNAGLGPAALRDGDTLALGDTADPPPGAEWGLDPAPWFDADPRMPIALVPGAHADALDARSREALFGEAFRIGNDSNRVGYRLEGVPLRLATPIELVSGPVTRGTLQLPPGGTPIVLMAEHPVTGGYPRIGQVAAVDAGRLAQRRPGDGVRFVATTAAQAQSRYIARRLQLDALLRAIRERRP